MKNRPTVVLILFGLGLILSSGFVTWRVLAGNKLSDDQRNLISNQSNCAVARSTISRLHSSDALMRVNLGQSYESIATRLMARFNERAASNNYQTDDLVSSLSRYNKALNKFRTVYKDYEEQLSTVLAIDCTNSPETFYDALMSARTKRQVVASQQLAVNQLLDEYSALFEYFVEVNQL